MRPLRLCALARRIGSLLLALLLLSTGCAPVAASAVPATLPKAVSVVPAALPPTVTAQASAAPLPVETVQIGSSVEGRPILVTRVGRGDQVALVVVGGIHGDEVNTEQLVRGLMGLYSRAPESVPPGFSLYFLPLLNPDGLVADTRENAHGVDLNRNWPTDDWRADAARTAGIIPGSGGTAPGSEPEVRALGRWLLETVQPAVGEVWLLSYHAAYPPDGSVQPGYTVYDTPGAQADRLARRVAKVTGYTYLASWPSEYRFTGELTHWCDVHGIWSADVELPNRDLPDAVPADGSETALATHWRTLQALLAVGGD